MDKLLCIALWVIFLAMTDSKHEKNTGKLSLCEEKCKYDVLDRIGADLSKDKRSARVKCICPFEKETIRKTRSLSGGVNETTKKNRSGSSSQEDNDQLQECKGFLKLKRKEFQERNITKNESLRPGKVDQSKINATFVKRNYWLANVTWDPPKENVDALESYLIYFSSSEISEVYCEELPKDKTFKVVNGSSYSWTYPDDLQIIVVALPDSDIFTKSLPMRSFSTTEIPEIKPYYTQMEKKGEKHIEEGNITKLQLSLIIGVSFGFVIFLILVFIYRRRKGTPLIEEFETIQVQASKPKNVDTYFASYLPENEKFSNEVATIAYKLGTMGYKVVFDQVDSVHINEIGFNMWVDKQILERKKYIVFCSPSYVRLWQSLATSAVDNRLSHVNKEDLVRVRYEIKRISDVYSENCSTSRIVCIKMDPKMSTKLLPPWMNHNMLLWPEQKEDIIRRLNDQAAMVMHV